MHLALFTQCKYQPSVQLGVFVLCQTVSYLFFDPSSELRVAFNGASYWETSKWSIYIFTYILCLHMLYIYMYIFLCIQYIYIYICINIFKAAESLWGHLLQMFLNLRITEAKYTSQRLLYYYRNIYEGAAESPQV